MGKIYLGDIEITNYDALVSLSSTTTQQIQVLSNTTNVHTQQIQALLDRIIVLEREVFKVVATYNVTDCTSLEKVEWFLL